MNPVSENNITVMKYKINGNYKFRCMDKFDEPDEVLRLDKMILEKEKIQSVGGEVLWIKTLPIFDIPQE